ncbi:hypothetical protein F5Y18DRAFT_9824 [Xylariaceae sp. FL1019]|nr:hypothetical protein F5Y18DRAFT_9824 [Xylariaceae sp. FL1019]
MRDSYQTSEPRPPMDRLKALKPATPASGPKDDRRYRAPAKKTRGEHAGTHKKNVIYCRTEAAYTCQSSLLSLLNAKSYNTLRPLYQDDSQRSIEFNLSFPTGSHQVPFSVLLEALCCQETLFSKLPYLDALEQSLVDALSFLHSHNISFPISTSCIAFSRHRSEKWNEIRSLRLFLSFNKKACWASNRLPSSWKTDQLACAESIFFVPKLLIRLAATPPPIVLDFASQHALAVHLKDHPSYKHDKYCLDISPLTAKLAHQIAYCLVMRSKAVESRDVLELFFGGPLPLPELGTPPDTIYRTFSNLRARTVESAKQYGGNTVLDQDLEAKLLVDSPAIVTRFVCCRAEVASGLRQPDKKHWWLIAMDLYDAFLASQGPSSSLERVCAFDLNHIRPVPA